MYFLGSITCSSGACSNAWTGPSGLGFFNIPPSVKSLYLQPSASNIGIEFSIATGISFQTTAARCANLDVGGIIYGPFRVQGGADARAVVGIFNTTGGTVSVRVYAAPTS